MAPPTRADASRRSDGALNRSSGVVGPVAGSGIQPFRELWRADGEALTERRNWTADYVNKVHFGYTDGISQPTITVGPETPPADHQQPCEPWLFVLLDEALSYYVPDPPELGRNGSFVAFRAAAGRRRGLRSSSSPTGT
jgi:hypothetical protein